MFVVVCGCLLSGFALAQPTQVWSYTHNTSSTGHSLGKGKIAVDPNGYVHVCNDQYSSATLLSPSGQQVWSKNLWNESYANGVAVGIDASDNTYVLTDLAGLYFVSVTKLDPGGNILYSTPISMDLVHENVEMHATSMAVTSDGTVYAAGYYRFKVSGARADAFLVSIASNGVINWTQTWGGALQTDDIPIRVRLHPGGGVVVGVLSDSNYTSSLPDSKGHMGALRYDASGNLVWATFELTDTDAERTQDMDVAANGDVLLVGDAWGPNAVYILRLDSSGAIIQFSSWPDQRDSVSVLAARYGSDGSFYVTGGRNLAAMTQKWSSSGTLLWTRQFYGPVNYYATGVDVEVDSAGSVYSLIEGYFGEGIIYPELFAVKYFSDGSLVWPTSGGLFFNSALTVHPNVPMAGSNLYLDGAGSFYVGGGADYRTGPGDVFAAKFHEQQLLQRLTLSPSTIVGGGTVLGTVRLALPAAAGGVNIGLSSDSNGVALSTNSVYIPEGQGSATFNITVPDPGTSAFDAHITAIVGLQKISKVLKIVPTCDAQFVSQALPTTNMVSGQTYKAILTYKNTGKSTWTRALGFQVESVKPYDNWTWGTPYMQLASMSVPPGATGQFIGYIYAPMTPGSYNFAWQVGMQGVGHFGQFSPDTVITVSRAMDGARYLSTNAPTVVAAGSDFDATVTFKNVGTSLWSSGGGYKAVSDGPAGNSTWGVSTLPLSGYVPLSESAEFYGIFTAPSTPGTYAFRWSMEHGATLFGDSIPKMITVVPSALDSKFVGQNVPATVAPGMPFNATLKFKNVGSATWNALGTTFVLVSESPYANTTWGTSYKGVAGLIAPGATSTMTNTFVAPSSPGIYHFAWRLRAKIGLSAPVPFGEISDFTISVSAAAPLLARP